MSQNRNRTYDPLKVVLIIVVAFLIAMILLSVGTTLVSTPSDIAVALGFVVMLLIPVLAFLTFIYIKNNFK